MTDTFTIITNDKAVGGRLGLWWPEVGLEAGLSGMYNGDYVAGGFEDSISLWAVDLNYHKGNWDVRAEYGMTYQQAQSFGVPDPRQQHPPPGLLCPGRLPAAGLPQQVLAEHRAGLPVQLRRFPGHRPDDPGL